MEITHYWDKRETVNYFLVSGITDEEKQKLRLLFEKNNMPLSGVMTPPLYPAPNGRTYDHLFRFVNRPASEEMVKEVLYRELRATSETKVDSVNDSDAKHEATIQLLKINNEELQNRVHDHHNDIKKLLDRSNTYEDAIRELNASLIQIAERFEDLHNSVHKESEDRRVATESILSRMNEMNSEFEGRLDVVHQDQIFTFTTLDRLTEKNLSGPSSSVSMPLPKNPPSIVVTGQSKVNRDSIESIIKEILSQRYDDIQRNRNLFIYSDKDYNNKNMAESATRKIQSGVDYVITGPGAHSIKGKPIREGWKQYSPRLIEEFRDKGPMTETFLRNSVELILKNHEAWKNR